MAAPRLATQPKISTPARSSARFHSITSSARARVDCGTVRPSVLAVFKLPTSSNFVGILTDGLRPGEVAAAGMMLGIILLVLGLTGWIGRLARMVSEGLQLASDC